MEVSVLQKDLEEAQSKLRTVDNKIKEATGIDPSEKRQRIVTRGGPGGISLIRRSIGAERRAPFRDDLPDAKRRFVSEPIESPRTVRRTIRLSSGGNEHDDRSKTLSSAVVVSSASSAVERPAKLPGQSAKTVARDKRMFGMLMGTLQRFKTDETTTQAQTAQIQKQKEIDERLEENKRKTREETQEQRRMLFQERREQTAAVIQLKNQIQLAELQKEWIAHRDELKSDFILVKSFPPIFYRPAVHTSATRKLVEETHRRLDEEAAKRHETIMSEAASSSKQDGEEEEKKEESHGSRHERPGHSGAAATEDDTLTFDAAADGIIGLPGVEEASMDVGDPLDGKGDDAVSAAADSSDQAAEVTDQLVDAADWTRSPS